MLGDNYPFMKDEEKEGYTLKEAVSILSKAKIYYETKRAIKRYGLERTEDIIKRVYKTLPKLRENFLKMLYEIWKGL